MWFGKLLSVIKREYYSRKVRSLVWVLAKDESFWGNDCDYGSCFKSGLYSDGQREDMRKFTEKEEMEVSGFTILSRKIIKSRLCDQSDYLPLHWEHTCCI